MVEATGWRSTWNVCDSCGAGGVVDVHLLAHDQLWEVVISDRNMGAQEGVSPQPSDMTGRGPCGARGL